MDRPRKEPAQSWPDLLPELVGLILRLLPCHIDRLRFRSVCRRWRLAEQQHRAHLPPPLPFIFLNNRAFLNLTGGEVRRAGEAPAADVVVHGCFDGWLLYGPDDRDTYDRRRRHKCFLTNPLTGATVEMPLRLDDLASSSILYVHKLIVCSPHHLIAVTCGSSVAFYRPGATSWSVCPPDEAGGDRGRRSWYVDFVFHRGKIFALTSADELFVHDAATAGKLPAAAASHVVDQVIKASSTAAAAEEDPEEKFIRRYKYLVVSCTGKLLMVKWTVPPYYRRSSTTEFDGIMVEVLEADLEKGRWVEVKSLACVCL